MSAPAPEVVAAFGGAGHEPVLLAGGQRRAWRVGGLVLKPVDNPREHDWVAQVFDDWEHRDVVRVPRPIRAPGGSWADGGWSAHVWVAGEGASVRVQPRAVRAASDAFHDAIADLARPAFLDDRDDPWSFGDRVAWDGAPPVGHPPTVALLTEAAAALQPVAAPAQMVHGDIGGNVLIADRLPPAVIDWPPYFRPRGFALAVAAVDAISWDDAPLSLLDDWSDVPDWGQLLLRAFVYRAATIGRFECLGQNATPSEVYAAHERPVLDAVLARLG